MGGRDISIDVCKGLGIILVVFGHLPIIGANLVGLDSFVYQFHVPLFFFLSGVFFKEDERIGTFFIKKVKGLYIPFLIANVVFVLIDLFKAHFNTQVSNGFWLYLLRVFAGLDTSPLGSPSWFLIVLFRAALLYKLLDYFFRHNVIFCSIISILLFVLGLMLPDIAYVGPSLTAVLFYHLGHMYGKLNVKLYISKIPSFGKISAVVLAFLVIWVISTANHVDMRTNEYGQVYLFLMSSILGVLAIILFSMVIMYAKVISGWVCKIGKSTLWVLLLHLFIFRVVILSHELLLSFVPWNYDIPMWLWYSLCFVLGCYIPVVVSKAIGK